MTPEARLEQALKKQGISRQAAADRLDVSLSSIAMYFSGNHKIRKVVALAAQAEFGISAEWIMSGKGAMLISQSKSILPPEAIAMGELFDTLPRALQADAQILLQGLQKLRTE